MATKAQTEAVVNKLRLAVSNIINGADQFYSVATENGATGILNELTDEDLAGANAGLTANQIRAAFQNLAGVFANVQDTQKNPDLAKSIYAIKL